MDSSICFSGCGWAFIYYLGIAKYLQQNFYLDNTTFLGVSGGCFPSIFLAINYDIEKLFNLIKPIALFCNSGYFNTSIYSNKFLLEISHILPDNVCNILKNKIKLSVTRLPWFNNILIDDFDDKNELLDAVICSCYSPIFFPNRFAKYRGNYYLDGMLSNDNPIIDENTILISAFFNKDIILKKSYMSSFYYPGNYSDIQNMFEQGYTDAFNNAELFIKKNLKIKNLDNEKFFNNVIKTDIDNELE